MSSSACSAHQAKSDNFRSTEKYCDLKIRVHDQYFPCHRVILASASEYFDALLGGNFRERDAQEIVLHDDIDVETFEEVLRCVYNSHEYECKSTVSNIYKLLSASLFLRIHFLEIKCVSYIVKNVSSIRDHVQIFALAQSMKITELVDVVSDYIVKNFDLFYDDEQLLEFLFEDVSCLLNRWSQAELLWFKYETLMLHFLIRWMRHAPGERRKYFLELIGTVNFDEVSSDYATFMLQHVKNFAGFSERKQLLGKRKLDSAVPSARGNTDEDLRNSILLKRTISEHFLGLDKSSVDCDPEIPASFHDPTFYKNALGLHVFVKYSLYYHEEIDHARVLSSNEYYPKWIVSSKTNPWKDCRYRWTGPQESTKSLYCMEILNAGDNLENSRQRFCAYLSVDMKSASKVLASPPITLKHQEFAMCTIPHSNNIYLRDSQMVNGGFRPEANDLFSTEGLNQGFYTYDCILDKWFSAPPMKFKQFHPCLTADHSLIYSIGGWMQQERSKQNIAQAFDYRAGKWMKLPNHSDDLSSKDQFTRACIFQKKVFLTDGVRIESFDTVAHKWEKVNSPSQEHCSLVTNMVAYDNSSLLLFVDYAWSNELTESDYIIATYRPQSRDWHTSKALHEAIYEAISDEGKDYHVSYDIKDVITFKM